MPSEKVKTVTFFCRNCGETKTFRENDIRVEDLRTRPRLCKGCLKDDMIEAVSTMDHDAT